MTYKSICIAIALTAFIGCKKDSTKDPNVYPGNIDFSRYQMYNDVGDASGIHGSGPDDDYQMEDWQPWVYNMFKPLDTTSLSGTTKGTIGNILFYPSPTVDYQAVLAKTNTYTVFKFVVIDPNGNVLLRHAFKVSAGAGSQLYYSLKTLPKGLYRIYYSLSADGNEHFYRAHTDTEKM